MRPGGPDSEGNKRSRGGDSTSDALNAVVLYVRLPASILLNAPKLEFRAELLAVAAVPWLALVASTTLV